MKEARRLKILLTEGSSLSARQTLYVLGKSGHLIDLCDSNPIFCLGRYSRWVRRCYRCPPFATDPLGYMRFLRDRLAVGGYDVVLPVHDQVFLLSRFRDQVPPEVGLAVPDFPALERLQGKADFVRLLEELRIPHPPTDLVRTREALEDAFTGPCFVKLPYSTAGCGVWRITDRAELRVVADAIAGLGRLDGSTEVLVQRPAPGTLCVVQTVFQRGRLVGGHCYQARALGVGGSARARESVAHPQVLNHLAAIGAHLNWHGALTMDYLYDFETNQPAYVDANPRIGETLNATLSGVNLCDLLLRVALNEPIEPQSPGQVGVRTHTIIMSLLAEAQQGASRRQLLAELGNACAHRGLYERSQDELTRIREDPWSVVPAAYLGARLLLNPRAAQRIIEMTVNNYALTETTARVIRNFPGDFVRQP